MDQWELDSTSSFSWARSPARFVREIVVGISEMVQGFDPKAEQNPSQEMASRAEVGGVFLAGVDFDHGSTMVNHISKASDQVNHMWFYMATYDHFTGDFSMGFPMSLRCQLGCTPKFLREPPTWWHVWGANHQKWLGYATRTVTRCVLELLDAAFLSLMNSYPLVI